MRTFLLGHALRLDAGVVGYFSTRSMVNLDGVVNNEFYRYVSEQRLTFTLPDLRDYLLQKRIDYVTDYEIFCDSDTLQQFDWLEPVFAFPDGHGTCIVRVYRII